MLFGLALFCSLLITEWLRACNLALLLEVGPAFDATVSRNTISYRQRGHLFRSSFRFYWPLDNHLWKHSLWNLWPFKSTLGSSLGKRLSMPHLVLTMTSSMPMESMQIEHIISSISSKSLSIFLYSYLLRAIYISRTLAYSAWSCSGFPRSSS